MEDGCNRGDPFFNVYREAGSEVLPTNTGDTHCGHPRRSFSRIISPRPGLWSVMLLKIDHPGNLGLHCEAVPPCASCASRSVDIVSGLMAKSMDPVC